MNSFTKGRYSALGIGRLQDQEVMHLYRQRSQRIVILIDCSELTSATPIRRCRLRVEYNLQTRAPTMVYGHCRMRNAVKTAELHESGA